MKNKKRVTIIIVLLIAVMTASLGILYGHKLRKEDMKRAGESGAEQQIGSDEKSGDAGAGPESGGRLPGDRAESGPVFSGQTAGMQTKARGRTPQAGFCD